VQGQALLPLGTLPADWVLLIWTMIDRQDEESNFRHFWSALPSQFSSGLSCSESMIEALKGSPAFEKFRTSRQHIQDQYIEMKPLLTSLVKAYPAVILDSHVSHQSYMWAVQLWYAYAMEVEIGGTIQQCLVPGAHFFNHSLKAAIRNYGRLEESGVTLSFPAASEVNEGEEICLSYGQLPNEHLLLFYGFALRGNGHDTFFLKVGPGNGVLLQMDVAVDPMILQEWSIQVALSIKASIRQLQNCLRSLEELQEENPCKILHYAAVYIQTQIDVCSWHLKHLPA